MERKIRQTSSAWEFLQNYGVKSLSFGSPSPKFYLHCLQLSQTATLVQVNIGNPEITNFFYFIQTWSIHILPFKLCVCKYKYDIRYMRIAQFRPLPVRTTQLFKNLSSYRTSRLQNVQVTKRPFDTKSSLQNVHVCQVNRKYLPAPPSSHVFSFSF